METTNDIGSILKAERELRGLTLDVVQEATKIPIDSLKAIEEGYKIRTLTAFYYKSFVRLYAQHLGLDPLPILAMIPSYQPVSKVLPAERSKVFARPDLRKLNIIAGPSKTVNWSSAVPAAGKVLAVVLIGGILLVVGKGIAERLALSSRQSAPVKASAAVKTDKTRGSAKVEKAGKSEKTDKVEKTAKLSPGDVSGSAEVRRNEAMTSSAVPADDKELRKVSLTVKAVVTAWLTVRSDGRVVFKGSLKKGSAESWHAAKKIEISGKEVNMLEYEVNGKTIGRLSRRDSSARRVVVTPEGLSVEK